MVNISDSCWKDRLFNCKQVDFFLILKNYDFFLSAETDSGMPMLSSEGNYSFHSYLFSPFLLIKLPYDGNLHPVTFSDNSLNSQEVSHS